MAWWSAVRERFQPVRIQRVSKNFVGTSESGYCRPLGSQRSAEPPARPSEPIAGYAAAFIGITVDGASSRPSRPVCSGGITYEPDPPDLLTFAFDGFDPRIPVTNGDAAEKLVERFGQPLKVDKRSGPDSREPGVITEVETWHYDGLEVAISGDFGFKKRWIGQITLTSPKYKLKFGLVIGSPKKAFIERLGQPRRLHSNSELFSYVAGSNGPYASVDVYFDKSGHATKIVWGRLID